MCIALLYCVVVVHHVLHAVYILYSVQPVNQTLVLLISLSLSLSDSLSLPLTWLLYLALSV